jgi:hypothetical protein
MPPSMMDYIRMRFQKVHPRCLVYRAKITHSYMGSVDAYEGILGDIDRSLINRFGKGGAAVLTGNIHYLWSQTNPYEQERAFTGKLLFSFKTPTFFIGRWTTGYSPRRLLYQSIFTAAWGVFLSLLIIYLIISNSLGNATPILLMVLVFFIGWTIFAFFFLRPLIKVSMILERQPVPKV